MQLEELCSPGPSQGTRTRKDTNEPSRTQLQIPGLVFPKLWWYLDKSFGLSFFLLFLFFFFPSMWPDKTVMYSCLQPCVTIPSLMNLPGPTRTLHNSHVLFLPCKLATVDFQIKFPSLETKQREEGQVIFLSVSPFECKSRGNLVERLE